MSEASTSQQHSAHHPELLGLLALLSGICPFATCMIIGGGPSGLSAAIAAKKRGLDYQVLEQGVLVNSIFNFPPQMVFFTTPELLEIGGLPFVSPYDKPTRAEALRYYRKVVDTYDLQIAFERRCCRGSIVEAGGAARRSSQWRRGRHGACAASGTRATSCSRSATTIIRSVSACRVRICRTCFITTREPHPYYRQRVVMVGGGNSAAETALETVSRRRARHARPPALRAEATIKYWVRPDIENRIKEGSIAARFGSCVKEIRPTSVVIGPGLDVSTDTDAGIPAPADSFAAVAGHEALPEVDPSRLQQRDEEIPADVVFLLTGYRADARADARAGVDAERARSAGSRSGDFETNVPGLFVAGGAIAGVDTGTIFIENGRFHGEKIIETIARRSEL